YDRPHGGFAALWANTRSTFYDALGRNPELQSGAYRRTLDTTVPHQFFATSMIPTPLFRGLFGLAADAPRNGLTFAPRLPADWEEAAVHNYPVGEQRIDIEVEQLDHVVTGEGEAAVRASYLVTRFRAHQRSPNLDVHYAPVLPPGSRVVRVTVDDRPVPHEEMRGAFGTTVTVDLTLSNSSVVAIYFEPGVSVVPRRTERAEGTQSSDLRVISLGHDERTGEYSLRVEGLGGATYEVELISPWSAPTDLRGGWLRAGDSGRYTLFVTIEGEPGAWHHQEIRFRNR
ncbi:MAG TPA: hypothetical protein VLC48_09295, partial [Gemmatimonadota bacterium]|nr:hypothetical protein [Gemmatimonadota bacterium]